jgi:hypothetical protein
MKRKFLVLALLLSGVTAFAATTSQKWTAGWDNFSEPLNYKKSAISWSVNSAKSTLSVTFKLVGATPSKLYGVGFFVLCKTLPATFGQFPTSSEDGNCTDLSAQGVTKTAAGVGLGVVTTDIYGNGSFSVIVGPIASGTYQIDFAAIDGAIKGSSCDGNGGIDFQSPGPTFGDATTITIP